MQLPSDLLPAGPRPRAALKPQLPGDKTRLVRLKTSDRLATFRMYEGVSLNLKPKILFQKKTARNNRPLPQTGFILFI